MSESALAVVAQGEQAGARTAGGRQVTQPLGVGHREIRQHLAAHRLAIGDDPSRQRAHAHSVRPVDGAVKNPGFARLRASAGFLAETDDGNQKMARVLIAGCGYVGTALADLLASERNEIFTLRRSDVSPPRGATAIRADLLDIDALAALPPRLDLVCYMASAGGTDDRSYRSAYVDGLRYLLAALHGQPVRRLLFASSTGVYAQSSGEWVDEESPAEPVHFSGRRLLEGEHLASRAAFPATVVRFAGIYGPGRTRLVDSVRRGEATLPGGPPVYSNRIHRDDCAGVLHHLMGVEDAAALYLAADREPTEASLILGWLAERLGVAPPPRATDAEPHRRYGRVSNKRVGNARLLASGYRFRYPTFREGYAQLIDPKN